MKEVIPTDINEAFGITPVSLQDDKLTVSIRDHTQAPMVKSVLKHLTDYDIEILSLDDTRLLANAATKTTVTQTVVVEERTKIEVETTDQLIIDFLRDLELVTEKEIAQAYGEHLRTNVPIGEVLAARDVISDETLIAAKSRALDIPRVDVSEFNPEPEVGQLIPEDFAFANSVVCVGLEDTKAYVVVADALPAEAVAFIVENYTHRELVMMLATRNSIDVLLQRVYVDFYSHQATHALMEDRPEDSAFKVISTGQKVFFILALIVIAIGLLIAPLWTGILLMGISSLFYMSVSAYRLYITWQSFGHQHEADVLEAQVAALDERDLPIYTILVPLYKEAGIVPRLVNGINGLDYPKSKLDIKLLCEADDDETIQAIVDLNLPPQYKLVVVPDSLPKTKPKACNYGIAQARGKYTVIFDAEDKPDPDQLKKAIVCFQNLPENVVCVQAKLNYFNQDQNILTRWFSTEYSMHFDLILPGLSYTKVPIPLGGTSNHFITEKLLELGAWDPYNVTEDADLGIRLHKAGYLTSVMNSTTLEEANSEVGNWIRQRSRWIKGYIQTWLVHMRHPLQLLNTIGLKNFIAFNLIVGGAFVFLLNPIFWGLTTLFVFTQAGFIQALFPGYVFYIAASMLFIGNFLFMYLNVAGSLQRGYFSLIKYALFSPLYWGLMSWAAWKGFIQLFTNPFYWEKTEHGLDE